MRPTLSILAATLALATGAGGASSSPEGVWLQSNLRELYPRRVEACVVTYTQLSDPPGVLLSLHTDLERFSHYRYTLRRDSLHAEPPRRSRDGSIPVRFDPTVPRSQRVTVVVEAVPRWGRASKPHSITLAYHPRAVYAAARLPSPSWLVVEASDLSLCGSAVDDWMVERTLPEDRAYARRRWGGVVKPLRGDHEKAKAVARDVVRALQPHTGVPSNRMQHLPPFEQLERAEAGMDHVWCGNYADVFSGACNALGIPVRKIDMQFIWSSREKTSFGIAEGHRTTELFDRGLDRWIWMDLTFGILGAELDGEALNLAEMVQALHDERRVRRLRLLEYDPARGVEGLVPVTTSRHRKDLLRFFRVDQRYQYARRARP